MSIETILTEIDAEIARLTQIRTLLSPNGNGNGSSKAVSVAKTVKSPAGSKLRKPRVLSPEARKRIADAQHKRWAAQRAKSK